MKYRMVAPCYFGCEAATAFDVRSIGAEDVQVTDGRVAFTGDEEINSKGAEEVMQWMSGQSIRPAKVLVLDVTNEGYADEAAYAIENDSGFDILSGYRIVSALQEAQVMCTVVTDAEPDESWTYSKGVEGYAPLPCLSLCIPADGELHGAAGVCIRKAAVPLYQQMLATLAAL